MKATSAAQDPLIQTNEAEIGWSARPIFMRVAFNPTPGQLRKSDSKTIRPARLEMSADFDSRNSLAGFKTDRWVGVSPSVSKGNSCDAHHKWTCEGSRPTYGDKWKLTIGGMGGTRS
jgi:hypothetical protein